MVANRTREIRPSGMKRGAWGNMGHACTPLLWRGGNVNPPHNRKGGSGNPPPKGKRTSALSRPPLLKLYQDENNLSSILYAYLNYNWVEFLFNDPDTMQTASSPVYGEKRTQIRFRSVDLIWRPVGILVRFVAVIHPVRGRCILMCTDLGLPALEIIRLYGLRFKIELSFKQAIRVLGTYAYHFWMRTMKPIKRFSGDQYLHKKPEAYRQAVRRKIDAYHRYVQTGLIAQGLLQYLSAAFPQLVFSSFGSWFRTIRSDFSPSEHVAAIALRNTFPEFLSDSSKDSIFEKFLLERIDLDRTEGLRLVA